MDTSPNHVPVLLDRCVELIAPAAGDPDSLLVDATLGLGGHAEAFLSRFPALRLVGIDRDRNALDVAGGRLERFGDRVSLVHAVYDEIPSALDSLGIAVASAMLFDLGVSSMQLDTVDRGFAYSRDAPLDMRMNQDDPLTAARVIAEYSEEELRRLFWVYGEEKLAARYARAIVRRRASDAVETSTQLVDILAAATPAAQARRGHPAKRVFQALRIEVNRELAALERAIPAALDRLAPGGRMVVLSYQSLEDRMVKHEFRDRTASSAPRGLPVELPEHRPRFRLLARGAELADADEVGDNPRAASVRLRAIERIEIAA